MLVGRQLEVGMREGGELLSYESLLDSALHYQLNSPLSLCNRTQSFVMIYRSIWCYCIRGIEYTTVANLTYIAYLYSRIVKTDEYSIYDLYQPNDLQISAP